MDNLRWVWQRPGEVLRLEGLPSSWWVRFYGRLAPIQPETQGILTLRQVHGSQWVEIHPNAPLPQGRPEADAWIVTRPGIRVGIQVADCLPILLADPTVPVFALVHAGWRGTHSGILGRVLSRLLSLGAQSSRLYVAFGPAIRGCHYEVGPEFDRLFPRFVEHRSGRRYLDLFQVHQALLQHHGVPRNRILPPPYCTYEHPQWFYSYRRERIKGRMWLVAGFGETR